MSNLRILMPKGLSLALCVTLLAIWLGSLNPATGQTFRGSILGLVSDSTGALIPDTKVVLVETSTGVQRVSATNSTGNYTFAELPEGTYKVTITKAGFKEVVSNTLNLTTQASVRFDATLPVGNMTESIEIDAQAPTLNTENAQLGTVLTRDELIDLPVNSRGATSFRYLSSSNQDGGYIAGQRSSFGFYSIDGVSAMAPAWGAWSGPSMGMSLEAVQDMTQVTATPSAEFGDVATISLSTRSGTNTLHASGFWDTKNYALDAAGYFSHSKPKGPYQQYFGGSAGGPVVIPHLYNGTNKTFFFFDWEEFLQPGGYMTLASVPTQAMRGGDFSGLLAKNITIYDPTSGSAFTGNIIPASRISSVSQNLQSTKYMPLPNFGAAGSFVSNYLDTFPNAHPHYYPTTRVDHNFRDGKDVISGRLNFRHQNEDGNYNGLPLFNKTQTRNTTNAYVSETHVFSPSIVDEFRVGYNRDFSSYHGTTKGSDVVTGAGLELPGLDALKGLYGFPQVSFENFTGYYSNANTGWAQDSMETLDNLTLTHSKHTVKIGFSYRHYKVNETVGDTSQNFGVMNFQAFGTQNAAGAGGFDYASYLIGIPYTSQTNQRSPNAIVRYGTTAGYIQEDWRITSKLTLNLGMRWEKTSTPVDQNDMRFTFDPATGNLVVPTQKVIDTLVSPVFPKNIPIVTAATAGFPSRSLVDSDQNWGPRAGFAYRLPYKIVVRGGFGLFYTPLLTYGMIDSFDSGPFNLQQTFHNRMTNGVPAFQFPSPFTLQGQGDFPGVYISTMAKKIRTPYTEQWNLTVEKELGNSTVVRANYRGHHTLETIFLQDLNQPHVSNDSNNEWNLVYPNFYNAYVGKNGGSEIGHLLELQLQRKYSKGLTFDLGYTHTKVVTDLRGSDILGWPEYAWNLQRDSGNENGLSRHRFVGSAVWELPFGTGKQFGANLPKWVQQSLGNWQTSYILVFQSGQFLDPSCGDCPDTSNARVWGGRPDLVGNPNISNASAQHWFNPQAFATPANGTLGNSSPGVIVGPGLANFDFGLFKYFQIQERLRIKLKMTATNFLNHPNLGNPNTNISSTNVATITGLTGRGMNGSSNNMRSIVLGARFDF
jgi:hypothetical protein